jgi:hypothetical protein
MSERAKILELMIVTLLVAAATVALVMAQPMGAQNVLVVDSQRGTGGGAGASAPAEAGNVSELLVNGTMITKTWQGYYGNVTGTIVLSDASSNEMYKWSDATFSSGEIYASNASTISWANVNCFNVSVQSTSYVVNRSGNMSYYELYLGLGGGDADGIDETFTLKQHSPFDIGTRTIAEDTCNIVQTYVSDAPQTGSDYIEVILFDNVTDVAVYAGLLNDSSKTTGFNDRNWDFQLMVPVQGGHEEPATTDTFYFFTELE